MNKRMKNKLNIMFENFCCSQCGYGLTDNKTSYCYDCGAKMEEAKAALKERETK